MGMNGLYQLLKNALVSCWRVFLLLIIFLTTLIAAAWWNVSDLRRIQPELETVLQQELQLSSLELGELSWSWGWHVGVKALHCSLSQDASGVAIQDATLKINFALKEMLTGQLWPQSIEVQGGVMRIHVRESASLTSPAAIPPIQLSIHHTDLHWFWRKEQGVLASVSLEVLPAKRTLQWVQSAFQARVQWSDASIEEVDMELLNTAWIPKAWREPLVGGLSGHIHVQKLNAASEVSTWQVKAQLQGTSSSIRFPQEQFNFPWDTIQSDMFVQLSSVGELQKIAVEKLQWRSGANQMEGKLDWLNGELKVQAHATHIDMPLLWSWLHPLNDDLYWHQWLDSMRQGVGSAVAVNLDVAWKNPLQAIPSNADWLAAHYRVKGDVSDADIGLGETGRLLHTHGHVDLDDQGLRADIRQAQLPQSAGVIRGYLTIPWDSLVLSVQGAGDVDVVNLLDWSSPKASKEQSAKYLQWQGKAAASSEFRLQWSAISGDFVRLSAQFHPTAAWHIQLHQIPLMITAGDFSWDLHDGLKADHLRVEDPLMSIDVGFSLIQANPQAEWELQSARALLDGSFSQWVAAYQLPISAPEGVWHAEVRFEKDWFGHVDFKQAAWENLLGSHKPEGQNFTLTYQGEITDSGGFRLHHLKSSAPFLQVDGDGELTQEHVMLNLSTLKSEAVDGALHVQVGLSDASWSMRLKARYLNRQALPDMLPQSMPKAELLQSLPWKLTADIDTFEWNKAVVSGVHVSASSKLGSVGKVHADRLVSKELSLDALDASFALMGMGVIDIRALSAMMKKNSFYLSAILTPEASGGLKWQGFSNISGNLGELMNKAELSDLFADGDMQALFLGEGYVFRDQAWWQGLKGRLRLQVVNGRVLKGGTLTKVLAALNWAELPKTLLGQRYDLTRAGLLYKKLQVEARLDEQMLQVKRLGMSSSALQMAGQGTLNLADGQVDMMVVAQPFQNLDAILGSIPILRDIIGGRAHSLFRKAYHMHGLISDAEVNEVSATDAGAPSSGLIDMLLNLPQRWFGSD